MNMAIVHDIVLMLLLAVFYSCGDSFRFTAAGNRLLVGR